jgi:hypothetical protein
MRGSRKELIFCSLFFGIAGLAWLGSEIRWGTINNPVGKFSTAREYLAAGRLPTGVRTHVVDGKTFYIAYGPADYWLAVPSRVPTYVFDDAGKLVAWYLNSTSSRKFETEWPLRQQKESSLEDLRKLPLPKLSEASTTQPSLTTTPKQ